MKQTITLPEAVGNACRCVYAMHELLEHLENTFSATLSSARNEAGVPDEREGAYWWMQSHYNEVGASVLAANVLTESLMRLLDELDGRLPDGENCKNE